MKTVTAVPASTRAARAFGRRGGKRVSAADATQKALAAIVAAKGGADRDGQILLARTAANAIARKLPAIIQAGTGTGKTFGYGVPALLSRRRVLIATHTKALQAQLKSDLEFLADTMYSNGFVDRRPEIAVLKGRRSYACMAKVTGELDAAGDRQLELAPEPATSADPQRLALEVMSLRQWAQEDTDTGDQAEVPFPHSPAAWDQVSVSADECLSKDCPLLDACFSRRAHDIAEEADVVVVNQALLAVDMKMGGAILPPADVVIVDEGHEFEDVIATTFGAKMSVGRLRQMLSRCKKQLPNSRRADQAVAQLNTGIEVFRQLPAPLEPDRAAAGAETVKTALSALHNAAEGLHGLAEQVFKGDRDNNTTVGILAQALGTLEVDLDILATGNSDTRVVWSARDNNGEPTLHTALFDVSETCYDALISQHSTVVVTSATLTVGGSFRHTVSSLGFDRLAEGHAAAGRDLLVMDAPSPFDYATQARLWLPPGPQPSDPGYNAHVAGILAKTIRAGSGRTLGLFTSWRALNEVHQLLTEQLPDVRILVQEPGQSATQLKTAFAEDPNAVLLGTRTFMTGISVEGPSCAAVVIDRLPFPSPGDPIIAARKDAAAPAGFSVLLTAACITLAQASGRLVRTVTDRGVVVLCDPRSRPYGPGYSRTIRASMPPMAMCTEEEALSFLTEIDQADRATRRSSRRQGQDPKAPSLPAGWDED